jgi:signal transduction histidine kinase
LESTGKVLPIDSSIEGIVINSRDITERKRAEEERERLAEQVRAENERTRALSRRLVEVQESERQRIARELHDDVGQLLTGLIMQLGVGKELLSDSHASEQVRPILQNAEEECRNTLLTVRRIITDLRPAVLDDLGLVPAINHLVDRMHDQTDLHISTQFPALPERLPLSVETALFRIVQESLTNIRNHARAHQATIALTRESDRVILLLTDDGVGIQSAPDQTNGDQVLAFDHESMQHGHYGLIGMRERAVQIGGTLRVHSIPGKGTTIRVELPLPRGKAP